MTTRKTRLERKARAKARRQLRFVENPLGLSSALLSMIPREPLRPVTDPEMLAALGPSSRRDPAVFGCEHARPVGVPCPHCLGIGASSR